MLLIVEKGTRGGICHAIHRYAKANNKYMRENWDKNEESSYLMYLEANNLYGWAMSQKLPVDGFKWKKNIHKFDEDFIKNYERSQKILLIKQLISNYYELCNLVVFIIA